MELLLRRELLAQEAERLGLRVSEEEIEDRIAQGRIIVVGVPRNITMDYRFASVYKDGFDYDKFKQNFCNYFLHTTPKKFIEEQRRELLAEKVKDLVRASTKISPEEVKRDYVDRETQVKLKFVRFGARRFEDELELSPAEIDAYLAAHTDKVKEQYDARSFMYKAVPKEERLRVILVGVAKDAPAAEVAKAEGRARAAADRARGGTDFAKLARELSDDRSKARGGDLGWRRKGSTGFGPALDDKVFALKKGDLSEVVKTDRGFVVARVEDAREGDLPMEAVSKEIAEDLLRKEQAAKKAKEEADHTLAKIKSGQTLEDLYAKEEKDDTEGGEKGEKNEKKAAASPKKPAADPNAPKLQETSFFPRRGNALEDIGVSKEAVQKVFGPLKKGEVAGPFEIQGGTPSYVVLKLEDRKDADLAAFDHKKDEIARDAAASKWATVLSDLAHRRCVEAHDGGRIHVNAEVLAYGDKDTGPYTPCTGFGMR
jgi:peptidyl-prolyl cis-trans isomerase D